MFKKIIVALSSLVVIGQAFAAGSAVLSMNVGGIIYAQPYWTVAGAQGSSVVYTFTNYAGVASGDYNLDSSSNALQLVIDPAAPVTSSVTLATPADCAIGGDSGTAIDNANVKLVTLDGVERNNGTLDTALFTQPNQTTLLRFNNVPSAASGSVTCKTSGSLTYSY